MGQGHIQKTTGKGTSRIQQVGAQPTAPDTSTSSMADSSFGEKVENQSNYAEQVPSSNIPQTADAGPEVVFGKLICEPMIPPVKLFRATLTGVENEGPLAKAICHKLSRKLQDQNALFGAVKMRKLPKGTEIWFQAETHQPELLIKQAKQAYEQTAKSFAYQELRQKLQKLAQSGVGYRERGVEPVQFLDSRPIDGTTVDLLLELGETAVMCAGQVRWATGVLQFLSERALDKGQLMRAANLGDKILEAVPNDPFPEVAATSNQVEMVTDHAMKEIFGNNILEDSAV